jgi:hypothetical protein
MRIQKMLATAALAVLPCWFLPGAEAAAAKDIFADGSGTARFPFEWREGVVVVPVSINGSRPYHFVLDTGSTRMLVDRSVAASLGLKEGEVDSMQGAGAGRVRVAALRDVNLQLPGLDSRGYDCFTADLAPLEDTLKMRVDGIIGYDFMARFVVMLDFAAHHMTVTLPSAFHPDRRAERIPLSIHDKWAFVKGELGLPGPVVVQDSFFIDLGSGDAVDHPVVKTMQDKAITRTGVGLGTSVEGAVARADYFRIGSFKVRGPTITCCGASEQTSRMIGTDILKRFTVTFDYPSSQLFLRPNASI